MKVKSEILSILILVSLGSIISCGNTIKKAQDFSQNKPPTLSISVSNPGNADIVPYNSYPVTVTASDPDAGQKLVYALTSRSGSFSSQTSTATGCTANFVAGDLAEGQNVIVSVKVSDGHGGYAASSINVGTAKQGPTVVVSASRTNIQPTGTLDFSVSANCEGVFQIWPDTSTNPASKPSAIDTSSANAAAKPMRLFKSGTSTISLAGPAASASADGKLSPSSGSYPDGTVYNVWVVFRDGLSQIDAVKVPVIVDNAAPSVTSWSPSNGAISQPLNPTVAVTFSEAIDPTTLYGALTVTSAGGSKGTVGAPVYDAAARTARYPVSGLSTASYTAQVNTTIKDLAGNPLSAPVSISFMTTGYYPKEITVFSINGVNAAINGTNITLTLPYGTSATALTPTITCTGTSISPASGVSRDFTSPVTYTVTAADGSKQNYTVKVTVSASNAKEITQFTILGVSGTITGNTIALTLPYATNVSALKPAITYTGAVISPASGSPGDFTSPVTYTVTAADGSTKEYAVTVTVQVGTWTKCSEDIIATCVFGTGTTVYAGTGSSLLYFDGTAFSSFRSFSSDITCGFAIGINIYVGTSSKGLLFSSDGTSFNQTITTTTDNVTGVYVHGSRTYVATLTTLYIYSSILGTYTHSFGSDTIYGVYANVVGADTEEGYAATSGGFYQGYAFNSSWIWNSYFTTAAEIGLPNATVRGVYTDAAGRIYVSTNGGLAVEPYLNGPWATYLVGFSVSSVCIKGNRIYAGTNWSGLQIGTIDGDTISWTSVDAAAICPDSYNIKGVYADSDGKVYVATERGLSVLTTP